MPRGNQLVRQWRILRAVEASRLGRTAVELHDDVSELGSLRAVYRAISNDLGKSSHAFQRHIRSGTGTDHNVAEAVVDHCGRADGMPGLWKRHCLTATGTASALQAPSRGRSQPAISIPSPVSSGRNIPLRLSRRSLDGSMMVESGRSRSRGLMMSNSQYWNYWGKSRNGETGRGTAHLLAYHSLDVAAVCRVLLLRHHSLRDHLASLLGIGPDAVLSCLPFLLALHDVGKFSQAFQRLRPELYGGLLRLQVPTVRHTDAGAILWWEHLGASVASRLGAPIAPHEFEPLAMAVIAHHGKPPADSGETLRRLFAPSDLEAVDCFVEDCSGLLLACPPLAQVRAPGLAARIPLASWVIAGLAVVCDWLGSDERRFRYRSRPCALDEYWRETALPVAELAVRESGLLPCPSARPLDFHALFGHPTPTPLQAQAESLPLLPGAGLFIVEDLTGSGKTEAAVMLAHRILSAGEADGFYVALPTMATADAMFERLAQSYRRLFADEAVPSLVLAHSSRELSETFRSAIAVETSPADDEYDSEDPTASLTCTRWLADSRKKALLAPAGVGTIDQALLAVLRARHQCLRVLGLQRKVLLVDEVHACDAYQNRLLERLLQLHAATGGSAILLSATLPELTRRRLCAAFASGTGARGPTLEPRPEFPLLTYVAPGRAAAQLAVRATEVGRRRLHFKLVSELPEVYTAIEANVGRGRCLCWVRNTVRDAVETADELRGRLGADRVTLLHARFALCDRWAIEKEVLRRFGPGSRARERGGHVVVATQVVEQSLDLDFDEMVSDLAPIDLLLQRAGRLRRHPRDAAGNRTASDCRGEPELVVFGPFPDPDAGHDWLTHTLPGTAAVYQDHARLWLSARAVAGRGRVELPEDSRDVLEAVYGEEAVDMVPAGLAHRLVEAEGAAACASSLGAYRVLDFASGYLQDDGRWQDRDEALTRLGEPTTIVRLARVTRDGIAPWAEHGSLPWRRSEVTVRRRVVAAEAPVADPTVAGAVARIKDTWPAKGAWHLVVPLVAIDERWRGQAVDSAGNTVNLDYSPVRGLEVTA